MASNDYKRQWIRNHRTYLKSIGQYYGSTYDPSHRTVTEAAKPKKDVGDTRHQSEASVKEYTIIFKDGTRLNTPGESPKQLREQYGDAKPIESIKRRRRKDKK